MAPAARSALRGAAAVAVSAAAPAALAAPAGGDIAAADVAAVPPVSVLGVIHCVEVCSEGGAGLDGDDLAAVPPDVVEDAVDELAALGWVGLRVPEGGEVTEDLAGALKVGPDRWVDPLQIVLAHHTVLAQEPQQRAIGLAQLLTAHVVPATATAWGGPGRTRLLRSAAPERRLLPLSPDAFVFIGSLLPVDRYPPISIAAQDTVWHGRCQLWRPGLPLVIPSGGGVGRAGKDGRQSTCGHRNAAGSETPHMRQGVDIHEHRCTVLVVDAPPRAAERERLAPHLLTLGSRTPRARVLDVTEHNG